jgi:hypothetical protein
VTGAAAKPLTGTLKDSHERGVDPLRKIAASADCELAPPRASAVDAALPHQPHHPCVHKGNLLLGQGGHVLPETFLHTAERGPRIGGSDAVTDDVQSL